MILSADTNEESIIEYNIIPGEKTPWHYHNLFQRLLILKRLAKDGFATPSGVPEKLADLALFIYLNYSRMVGPQKIAETLFAYLAKKAVKNGRLGELELKYCR